MAEDEAAVPAVVPPHGHTEALATTGAVRDLAVVCPLAALNFGGGDLM